MAKPTRAAGKAGALSVIAVGLLAASGSAAAPCPPPGQLKPSNVHQRFVQERKFAAMPRPLVSEGTLAIEGDKIVWSTTNPFRVRMTMSGTGMTQSIEDGPDEPMNMAGDVSAVVVRVTSALVRARWSELSSFFTVSQASLPGGTWRVILDPKAGSFAALLGKVEVTGCEGVTRVDIARANGDRETIRFLGVAGAPQ